MKQTGFTLLEVTIAIFIFSLGLTAIASMFVYFFNSYNFNLNQNITLSETKFVMEQVVRELRETRVSEIGSYPLITTADQELSFYSNIDDDDRTERVRYYITGSTLYRAVLEPNDTQNPYTGNETITIITEQLHNQGKPVFRYYNADWPGDVINNPLAHDERLLYTRLISIDIPINTNPQVQEDFLLSTQVHLRNLKTEY